MSHIASYLTPFPPERSGIADYASRFKHAIEVNTDWQLRLNGHERLVCNSFRDFRAIRQRVIQWQTEGRFDDVKLIHAEIGYKHHDEFYTLYWIKKLLPELPFCITVHDPPLTIAPALFPLCFGSGLRRLRHFLRALDYTPIGQTVIRAVLSHAHGLIVLSEGGKHALAKVLPNNSGICSLPHITYRSSPPGNVLRTKHQKPVTLLFSGFWGKEKGIDILIDAVGRIALANPNAVRLLMTGGLEKGGTNQLFVSSILGLMRNSPASKSIEWLGYLPAEELDSVFDRTDILVMPYRSGPGYSSSGALIRAMAAGMAVIATDTGVIREEIRHMDTGFIVPPNDVDALEQGLQMLVDDPGLRARLGCSAQKHIFTEHSEHHVADIVGRLYDSIAPN